jgi:two-component system LytT family response regulator
MDIVNAIIIDDEEHNRSILNTLLKNYCPNINVIDFASSAEEAYEKIIYQKPRLIFLDIKMPNKTGFDLLKSFDRIDFEVIFVTAYDEFAITAFDFNALGYILKPIDYNKLIKTVDKALFKINSIKNDNNINNFINTLGDKSNVVDKISVHHNGKVVLINILDIISVESNSGICFIKTKSDECYSSTKDLKLFDAMFGKYSSFVRISRSCIINTTCIKSYNKGDSFMIEMENKEFFEVSRRKKSEVLSAIKHI